jgi:hypothetical protein
LNPGDIVVGHIAALDDVNVLRAVGVFDIAMIRDLRNVLVSLFQFKLDKVIPTGPGDALWREADPRDRFVSFLAFHSDKDMEFVKSVAQSILTDPRACRVRFEDMLAGVLDGPLRDRLASIEDNLPGRFAEALGMKRCTSNPTFSGKLAEWRNVWDDRVDRFFRESGLQDLNARLGYA